MKEIKFRAWFPQDRSMIKPATLIELINGKCSAGFAEQCVFMQYTGLKDCDGVEIYEGDIIQMSHRNTGAYEVAWFQSDFGCGWMKKRKNSTTDIGAECNVMRVIGNIHQNRELLK